MNMPKRSDCQWATAAGSALGQASVDDSFPAATTFAQTRTNAATVTRLENLKIIGQNLSAVAGLFFNPNTLSTQENWHHTLNWVCPYNGLSWCESEPDVKFPPNDSAVPAIEVNA
jgi:hypothetical protein